MVMSCYHLLCLDESVPGGFLKRSGECGERKAPSIASQNMEEIFESASASELGPRDELVTRQKLQGFKSLQLTSFFQKISSLVSSTNIVDL